MKNLLLIIGVVWIAACTNKNISKAENEKPMTTETEEVRDISSIWILEAVNGSKIDAKHIFLDIKMNDLSFSGQSFCNSIFGKIEMNDSEKIKFTNMGMTMMACNEELNSMENEYNMMLRKISSYKIKKDMLTLYDYDGKLALQYKYSDTKVSKEEVGELGVYNHEKTPLLRLYDIWGLKKMNENKIDASNGMILEMNTKEMTFMGNASCNRIFGSLESTSESLISFVGIGATRKLCPDMTLENEYIAALRKVKKYQLKGLNLLMFDEEGKILLEYIKMD